jgi:Na+/H+ antiporter NhaD/arsenite permease-like protein
MALGPNLLVTGSLATVICRRMARDAGGDLGALRFSAVGAVVTPVLFAVAFAGLHLTGAL